MGTASNWKKSIIVLLSVVLLAALLPVFSTQAQGNAILALVRGRGATLYAQPGGDALRDLLAGDRLDATGRTQAGEWITGTTGDGQVGWLRAAYAAAGAAPLAGVMSPGQCHWRLGATGRQSAARCWTAGRI